MREPAVTYYTYNETPQKAWKSAPGWPLAQEKRTPYYFDGGVLGDAARHRRHGRVTRMTVDYGVNDADVLEVGHELRHRPRSRLTPKSPVIP